MSQPSLRHCRACLLILLFAGYALDGQATGSQPAVQEVVEVIAQVPPAWDRTPADIQLTSEELEAAGFSSGIDLAERITVLQTEATTPRLTRYGMRGLGSSSFNDGLESSIALMVDGIYLGRQGMFLADLGDLERIEVLRGPQGSIVARNNSAGAINVTTRPPTFQPQAGVELVLGNAELRHVRGHLSGPLIEGVLAGRLTVHTRHRAGLVENLLDGRRYNDEHRRGLRGQLLWVPADTFSARLIAEYARQKEACCVFPVSHYADITRASADFIGYRLPPAAPLRREIEHDTRSSNDVLQRGLNLTLDGTLGATHQLTSLTGWRDWHVAGVMDLDGIGLAIAPRGGHQLEQRQLSQELRLAGSLAEHIEYVAGTFYMRQQLARNGWLQYGTDAADWYAGALFASRGLNITAAQVDDRLLDGVLMQTPGRQSSDHHVLYGQLTWTPVARLQVRPGIRYSAERKSGFASRLQGNLRPLPADPFQQALALALRTAVGQPYYHRAALSEHHVSGQLTVSYQLSPNRQGHIRWSRGIKGGGINAEPVSRGVSPTFGAERATMLEAGLEQQFWAKRGRLQLALYQIDVVDHQALTYATEAITTNPQRDNLMNVGSVRSRGLDIDSTLQLTSGIRLRFAAAWNDARYRGFKHAPCPPGTGAVLCNQSGKRLSSAPEWSVTTGLETSYQPATAWILRSGLDYHWRSGFYGTPERGIGSYQAGRGLLNLRLAIGDVANSWELSGWVRNLLDEKYIAAIYALTGTGDYGAVPGDPRSYGLALRLNF